MRSLLVQAVWATVKMNTTLIEINEILVLLDKIMDDLFMGKIIRTGNEFYEEYKKKLKSFMQKNKYR